MMKDTARLTFAMLDKLSKGDLKGALDDALRAIEDQKDNTDHLALEFDRLYFAARRASGKLDVSVQRGEAQPAREYEALEEQVERLKPLFEQLRNRRG